MSEEKINEDIGPPYCYHIFEDDLSDEAKVTMIRIQELAEEDEPISIPVVAYRRNVDPFTIKTHIDELEESGLVIREESEVGKRRNCLRKL